MDPMARQFIERGTKIARVRNKKIQTATTPNKANIKPALTREPLIKRGICATASNVLD